MTVHLVKLCVGVESIETLARAQAAQTAQARGSGQGGTPARPWHVTRRWPRRADALLAGGSLYWVIRGTIQVRQRLLDLVPATDSAGRPACALRLDPTLVPVQPRARRPFQGWRYLEGDDAPPDLGESPAANPDDSDATAPLPAWLVAELADLGLS